MADTDDFDWSIPAEVFLLDDEQWAAFNALLDAEPKPDPRLVDLFNRPSPFND